MNVRFAAKILVVAMSAPTASRVHAAEEPAQPIAQGTMQVEQYVEVAREDAGGDVSEERSTPFMLRVGLLDGLELQIEGGGYAESRLNGRKAVDDAAGWHDARLGIKHLLWADEASAMQLSWIGALDLPLGSRHMRGSRVHPVARVVAEWTVGDATSFGAIPGVARCDDLAGASAGCPSIIFTAGHTLASEARVSMAWGWESSPEAIARSAAVDVTWPLDPGLDLYAQVSQGLRDERDDVALTIGLSWRP
jgi:hypothetical protein